MKRSPHIRALSALGGFIRHIVGTGELGVVLTVSVFLLWSTVAIICAWLIACAATLVMLITYDSPFIMTPIFAAIAICVWAVKVRNREEDQ